MTCSVRIQLVQRCGEMNLQSARLSVGDIRKKIVTLIKVMVAVFNLYVFKCLQDVHVNFMNPSVFVTQPSAKEKIDFPNETDIHTETEFLSIFSGLNCYRSNRTCTPNSGLFILKRIELISQFSVSSQHLLPFFTYSKGFPGDTVVKSPPANAGDTADAGLIPGLGRSSGGGNGNLLHYSCLENSMDRGAWRTTVHEVAESQTQLRTHSHTYSRLYFLGILPL